MWIHSYTAPDAKCASLLLTFMTMRYGPKFAFRVVVDDGHRLQVMRRDKGYIQDADRDSLQTIAYAYCSGYNDTVNPYNPTV